MVRLGMGLWLGSMLVGAALMQALPEDMFGAGTLFRLNDVHGPGRSDSVGLAVMLGGWIAYLATLFAGFCAAPRVQRLAIPLVMVTVVAAATCILAVIAGRDGVALMAGIAAVAAQFALGLAVLRSPR